MAMKSPEWLNRMPSVNELLDKPPIRVLADRWNRSVVAAGVRSFLEELRSDLQRRTADFPSIRELAERAARHVVQLQESSSRPVINATGMLLDQSWAGIPMSDAALDRAVGWGRAFTLDAESQDHGSAPLAADAVATLCRLTGAEAAVVVHSYSGAIGLTLSAIAAGHEVIVSRAESGDVEYDISLTSLAASAMTTLREVGAANRTSIADYEAAVADQTVAIVKHEPDSYQLVGQIVETELEQLSGLAHRRELTLVHAIGTAPLIDGVPFIGDSIPSVAARIKTGAHVVIARCDGLVGGPRCGLILGSRDSIRRIESHPMFAAWRVAPWIAAALQATLELYEDMQDTPRAVPVLQLLSAPVDNLRDRAERLAPQLAQARDVASAVPAATENSLGLARWADRKLPSYGIALTAVENNVQALDQRLRGALMPVIGNLQGDRLVLDLRGVFPREDQRLVEMTVGSQDAGSEESAGESVASL